MRSQPSDSWLARLVFFGVNEVLLLSLLLVAVVFDIPFGFGLLSFVMCRLYSLFRVVACFESGAERLWIEILLVSAIGFIWQNKSNSAPADCWRGVERRCTAEKRQANASAGDASCR